LADAVVLRLRRPDLAAAEAAAGRALVCRDHDIDRVTARIRSTYLDTIAGLPPVRSPLSPATPGALR
jgi:hypothetical protein